MLSTVQEQKFISMCKYYSLIAPPKQQQTLLPSCSSMSMSTTENPREDVQLCLLCTDLFSTALSGSGLEGRFSDDGVS